MSATELSPAGLDVYPCLKNRYANTRALIHKSKKTAALGLPRAGPSPMRHAVTIGRANRDRPAGFGSFLANFVTWVRGA